MPDRPNNDPRTVDPRTVIHDNLDTVTRVARRLCSDRRATADDFAQDLVVDLLVHAHQFDPDRGSFENWVWWRARRVRTRHYTRENRSPVVSVSTDTPDALDYLGVPEPSCAARHQHTCAVLHQLLDRASPKQAEAVRILALGLTEREIEAEYGVTGAAIRNRIAALRRTAA